MTQPIIEDIYPDVREGVDYAEKKFAKAIEPFKKWKPVQKNKNLI